MSAPVSAVHASPESKAKPKTIRRTADFHPSIWGDHFLKYTSETLEINFNKEQQQVQDMKEQVKMMLAVANPSETLQLTDTIQRLGLAYHFENEIAEKLREIKEISVEEFNDDLFIVSLWFRLLRQEGFSVSSDIFQKFKNKDGKFQNTLISNVEGMLSLYEAAHLMVHEEAILEEALAFTTTNLKSSLKSPQLSVFLAARVQHALELPIRKGMPRVEARHYISIYEDNPSHNEVLLNFAKLDFNLLQKLHQKELSDLTRWWKDLDVGKKLPFARDRMVESYFWVIGVYFEPQYSLARQILTKVIAMIAVLDDIYDVHGTFEELQLFTDAVHRWNISCLEPLPEYLKFCYRVLIEMYDEFEELMANEERGRYRIHYAKESMKKHVQSYFDEAKWLNENYMPNVEEHIQLTIVSSALCILVITSFLGMGDIATEEAFEWASKYPKIIIASSRFARLMDDVAGHKFEQQREHIPSSVECYMKQYAVSEEEAYMALNNKIVDSWKDINQECLEPRDMPMPLLMRVVNFARDSQVIYKDGDIYTHAGGTMKYLIKSMFVDPIPV